MPTTGTAVYAGNIAEEYTFIDDDGVTFVSNNSADLTLSADFATSDIDATMSNMRGTETVGGTVYDTSITGEFTGSGRISGPSFAVTPSGRIEYNDGTFRDVAFQLLGPSKAATRPLSLAPSIPEVILCLSRSISDKILFWLGDCTSPSPIAPTHKQNHSLPGLHLPLDCKK